MTTTTSTTTEAVAKKAVAKKAVANKAVANKAKAPRIQYKGKHIKPLVKLEAAKLRKGSNRAARLAAVLKAKTTDEVLGKKVAGHEITGANLAFFVKAKFIALHA